MSTLLLNSPEYETVNSKKKFSCVYSTNNYFFSVCDVLPSLSKGGTVLNVLRMLFWVKRHTFLNSYKLSSFAACRRYGRGTPNLKCEPFTLLLTNLLVQTRHVTFTFVIYHSPFWGKTACSWRWPWSWGGLQGMVSFCAHLMRNLCSVSLLSQLKKK